MNDYGRLTRAELIKLARQLQRKAGVNEVQLVRHTHERRKAAEARALDEPWRRELREKLRQAEAAR